MRASCGPLGRPVGWAHHDPVTKAARSGRARSSARSVTVEAPKSSSEVAGGHTRQLAASRSDTASRRAMFQGPPKADGQGIQWRTWRRREEAAMWAVRGKEAVVYRYLVRTSVSQKKESNQ